MRNVLFLVIATRTDSIPNPALPARVSASRPLFAGAA